MSFWINEKAGVAYESNESGWCKWVPDSKSFNDPMSIEEMKSLPWDARKRVSEDEAVAFAESHEDRHASA